MGQGQGQVNQDKMSSNNNDNDNTNNTWPDNDDEFLNHLNKWEKIYLNHIV